MNFFICDDFLTREECAAWLERAPILPDKPWRQMTWKERRVNLKNDPIVDRFLQFIKDKFGMETTCYDASYQVYPDDSTSAPHVHLVRGIHKLEDYTAIVYLNDDYADGEFYTCKWDEEITEDSPTVLPWFAEINQVYKPKAGSLILFDSMNIYHGVNRVNGNTRHSIVFWLQESTFEDDRRFEYSPSPLI